MLIVKLESFSTFYPDAIPLLERHWEEIAHFQDIPLDVDLVLYQAMEEAGALRCFAARIDGELVGYVVYLVRANGHYRKSLQAVQDVLFIAPEHRRSGLGFSMVKAADDALRAEGVQAVYQHSKLAFDIGPFLLPQGYEAVETIYVKRLDRPEA